MSFGFKHGLPPDADLVFDVRFLPNPHFVGSLRRRTGRAPSVVAYLRKFPATEELLTRTTDFLNFLLPQYVGEGKSYLTIAVGCTGGRHRSVAIAEALRGRISRVPGVKLRLYHRDIRMP
jgi:UPF0042 nucleotide-binding protein